ncbi:collagenase 3-like [Asterias amurensis]|uniref:collagenase 3-like n=1 Tax=Asterias amurensis TaxID=7602 RepID=UPI003AB110B0
MRRVELLCLVVMCAAVVYGKPFKDETQQGRPATQEADKAKGYEYLAKYGYFKKDPNKDADGVLPAKSVEKAIKQLQKFAGISESGEIDEATLELIAKPRCGVNDPVIVNDTAGTNASINGTEIRRRRYVIAGQPYQWNKNGLTYKIINFPGPPSEITPEQVVEDVRKAFQLWSDVTPLTFQPVEDENAADIRLVFGKRRHTDVEDDPTFDGPGGTLAHAFSPNSNWGATDGDAHFDEDENYTHGVLNGVNFFYTAAHEIGHTLGLDHSNVPNSLMWPWGKTFVTDFVLPRDDKDAIQSIYGANPNPPTLPPTTSQPPPAYCVAPISTVINIRDQLYTFSNDKLWRFDLEGNLLSDAEGELSRTYFPKLPRHPSAGYERHYDRKIHFFKGRNYWMYKSARSSPPLFKMYNINTTNAEDEPDFPRPVRELGLPKKMTAALHVADVGKTYFFKAKNTYILDEFEGVLAESPERIHQVFPDAEKFPSAAFYNDGYAYIIYFHGHRPVYYRFKWDATTKSFLSLTGYDNARDLYTDFLGCP